MFCLFQISRKKITQEIPQIQQKQKSAEQVSTKQCHIYNY